MNQSKSRRLAVLGRAFLVTLLSATGEFSAAQVPTGADVVAGQAAIIQSGNTLNVNAATSRTIIDWNSFNVGPGNIANLNLPDASSAILNRVTTPNMPSTIAGAINSNGNVYLVNPSGIVVSSAGMVNTNGFTASTFNVGNTEFMSGGALAFTNNGSNAAITNKGAIATGSGGAHLIANQIANQGVITSSGGNITLSSGGSVTLNNGVTYVQPALETLASGISPTAGLIQNSGAIRATGAATAGGEVYLVNPNGNILHDGTIAAQKVASSGKTTGGHVQLEAEAIELKENSKIDASGPQGGGTVLVGGEWQGSGDMTQANTVTMEEGALIDASATHSGDGGIVVLWSDILDTDSETSAHGAVYARGGAHGGNGGMVETSGHSINIDGFHVDTRSAHETLGATGVWLIDPYNYTIGSSQAATIATALNSSSVTVTTTSSTSGYGSNGNSSSNGDITVTSSITKTGGGAATLTLQAARHISLASGANISSNSGALNVLLLADSDYSGDGINQVAANISTNGGLLKFGEGQIVTINGVSTYVGGDVFFNGASAQTISTIGGALEVYGETIVANTAGLTIQTSNGNVSFNGLINSGNSYTFVNQTASAGSGNWDDARINARNGTAGGASVGDSYLVTISSRLENAIAGLAANYNGAWIGAYRPNTSSSAWTWADGPEAGQTFFTQNASNGGGTVTAGYYANFAGGEPNGTLNSNRTLTESVGQFFGNAGEWNDLQYNTAYSGSQSSQYNVLGYVRETNLGGSPITVNAGTGSVSVQGGVGTSKALASLTVTSSGTAVNGIGLVTTGAQSYSTSLTVYAGVSNLLLQASSITAGGAVSVTGANISFDAPLTATNNRITVNSGGSVTDGSAGYLVANSLQLVGGNYVLDHPSTNIGTLAAAGVGSLSFTHTNNLTIGNLASAGISATGAVALNVPSGNLVVDQGITTTNSSASAITLTTNGLALGANLTAPGGLTIRPATNGTTVGVGTGAGTLQVSAAELAYVVDGFSSITIGSSNAGLLKVGGLTASQDNLILQAGSAADLEVTGSISWSTNHGLTLAAGQNIWILNDIDVNGSSATLNLYYGGTNGTTAPASGYNHYLDLAGRRTIDFANTSANLKVGNETYTLIDSLASFTGMNASDRYALARNLDLTSSSFTSAVYNSTFTGKLDGLGHAANGMVIQNSSGGNLGLFAQLNGSTLRHLGVTNFNIKTNSVSTATEYRVGGLAGNIGGVSAPVSTVTSLDGVWSTGVISTQQGGTQKFFFGGGLAGSQNGGFLNVTRSYSTASVSTEGSYSSNLSTGGLIGDIGINTQLVSHTTTTSSVVDFDISKSYATGSIVQGNRGAYFGSGGLVGVIFTSGGSLTDSYSWGNVVGTASFGGIAGYALSGTYERNYTTQASVGAGSVATASSYNGSTLATATASGTQLPSGWDNTVWLAGSRPTLRLVPTPPQPLYVRVANGSSSGYGDALGVAYTIVNDAGSSVTFGSGLYANLSGTAGTGVYTVGAGAHAGSYSVSYLTGLNLTGADAANYTLNPFSTAGSHSITPRTVSVSASGSLFKVYDGSTSLPAGAASLLSFNNLATGDSGITVTIGSGFFNSAEVLTANQATLGGLSITGITGSLGSLTSDYVLSSSSAVVTGAITAKPVTVSGITAQNKIYDGTTAATVNTSGVSFSGLITGDTLTISQITGTFSNKNVGLNKTVQFSGITFGGADAGNYSVTGQTTTTANISAKAISVSGLFTNDKVYDGTITATVDHSGVNFVGSINGDILTATGTLGAFADKNAGASKSVTLSGTTYGGADVGNYTITNQTATTANISAKAISVSGLAANDKVYDGTTAATVNTSGVSFSGLITGDTLTISQITGAFNNKNVGLNKAVQLSGITYGGADAGNYSVTGQSTTTANISAKAISVSGIVANDKIYDGTTAATVNTSGVAFSGMITGDSLTISQITGAFNNKNVGTNKPVQLSGITYGGADAGNYSITNQTATTANISAKAISVSGLFANDKIYDGTTTATVDHSGVNFIGSINGDILTATDTLGAFADKNAGASKSVTLSGTTYGGADVGNYSITNQTATTANISTKAISVSGFFANDKVYDGTTAATVNTSGVAFSGMITGDSLTISQITGAFNDKNVGTNKTVQLSAVTYGGADAGNYSMTGQTTTTANISAKAISVSGIVANDKIYDGTTAATVNTSGVLFNGMISSDILTVSPITGVFNNKNVGANKPVQLSGITYGGADAGNYSFSGQTTTTANISAKAISVSGLVANDKIYDGTTTATVDHSGLVFIGSINGDILTAAGVGSAFADKNVGASKSVILSGTTYGGAEVGNYTITNQTLALATILRLPSVTWIGGPAGDWSNPANWAGGAIPDLGNVANVIIPAGVTPIFDSNVAGPVNVASISGGSLQLHSGALHVAGDVTLDTLVQTGGLLEVQGNLRLRDSYEQFIKNISVSVRDTTGRYASEASSNASAASSDIYANRLRRDYADFSEMVESTTEGSNIQNNLSAEIVNAPEVDRVEVYLRTLKK